MKLLILGGTSFLGRHCVDAALNKGYQVTLFNRNRTNSGLFPELERLVGDRDGQLDTLSGRKWDAVIDVNGYLPRLVSDSSKLLQGNIGHYVFISTGSVYDLSKPVESFDEQSLLMATDNIDTEEFFGPAYGGLKLLCERVIAEYFPEQSTILRPGLIAGPYDSTDRITYWIDRVSRGGEVFVPANPSDPIQFIDALDIAEFALRSIEETINGHFNTAGKIMTWGEWLNICQEISESQLLLTWVDDVNFIDQNLGESPRPLGSFPLMSSSIFKFNSDKALAKGLKLRSSAETARNILTWHNSRKLSGKECPIQDLMLLIKAGLKGKDSYWMCGISAEHEQRLLRQWHREQ